MTTMCYIVDVTTNIERMFEELNEYGFDYYCEKDFLSMGCMEIYIYCYPDEICDLEEIMKWYV